jgi:predicted SnoaL-like aldol condensation-catalyzing enzyme
MQNQIDKNQEQKNIELVNKAFDTLFNKRDYQAAEKFWSPHYIQHSAHIAPGREGLFNLIKAAPPTLKYENQLVAANGNYVMLHGRFSGLADNIPNWVVVDIVKVEGGILTEHWDVIQDEATRKDSKSGNPMYGDRFPDDAFRK